MNVKEKLGSNGLSRNISMVTALLSLVTLIVYIIYGVTFNYFDTVVCVFLAAAFALSAIHFLIDGKGARACNLLAVMCLSGAIALFGMNSYPVWADELNGITMYGSRGGLVPVVALLVLLLAAAVAEIISCFIPEREKEVEAA